MRLPKGGLINRDEPLGFRFDGRAYQGFAGDTLASALMASGLRTIARSFKYHRPRGVISAGSEEPNALITLGQGEGQEPNLRATTIPLSQGLEARSQNAFPSVAFDLRELADLAAPFLGAGFYYKTFMGHRSLGAIRLWERLFEPAIRRAAGLGRLSGAPVEAPFEKAFAFCDLLVIGAGPAGLMAALTAAEAGADVILADEDFLPGGRLNAERQELDGRAGADWAADMVARLNAMPNVRIMTRTAVTGVYDQGTFGAVERPAPARGRVQECFWRISARRAVLAAGAIERPIAFVNNDRPGVMLAGAMRAYVNRYAVAPGRSVVVFGASQDVGQTARDLRAAGVHLAAIVDARADADTSDLPADVPYYPGAMVEKVMGREVEAVLIRRADGRTDKIQADCLAMSGGWNPLVHLSCHLNGRPVWRDDIAGFVPAPNAVPGLTPAGACNGAQTTAQCLAQGRAAAQALCADLGLRGPLPDLPMAEDAPLDAKPIWVVPGKGRKWVDFQNDVTVKDVERAARENFRSVEHMKRYTTQGMATDQGKIGNVTALAVLADATGRDIPGTGTTTYRPPYVPVSIAAMGAGAAGRGFAPDRLPTSHARGLSLNAPMIEAGLWLRPSYFQQKGETTWRQSCDREVTMVRDAVGIADVSSLGKIDVQGPDAGAFLDFVYTNRMSNLAPGKVRYGLMLREDGHVMDDGTCACLGPDHFLVTTTTAAAGDVMRQFDHVAQVLRPEWDVAIASVTEHWAQFAVAGPKARGLIADLVDGFDPGDWPFMACGPVQIGGQGGRLFRISFSGEEGYEIAVPARYGEDLYRQLLARAADLGGGPYGIEALNILRIEKGFLTHAEMDGRTTAHDLGLGRMLSTQKDFIGRAAAGRDGLMDPARERLVGIRPIGAVRQLTAGAFLFDEGEAAERANAQGFVTSVGYSPTLGDFLGLAMVKHGPERIGQRLRMVDHLRDVTTHCEIVDPVFFDPDGARMRGEG